MQKKRVIYSLCLGLASLLISTGVVYAATHDITSFLGGTSGDFFDVKGTMQFDSIKVGRQGTGGVTFFNGTIINNTTGTGGADIPVTFGDNVRIDGRVYRGTTAGTSDSQPFIVNDNMEVTGSLIADSLNTGSLTATSLSGSGIVSSNNLASNSVTSAKITDGTIATGDLANSAVTSAKITNGTIATADLTDSAVTTAKISDGTIATADLASEAITQAVEDNNQTITTTTTGNNYDTAAELQITTEGSKLFCLFDGYGTINTPDTTMGIALLYDGSVILNSYRGATVGHDNVGHVILVTSAIINATAGTHTVQLGWNTSAGTTATMFYNTLDCIELKK
jgi:hypothetical protein